MAFVKKQPAIKTWVPEDVGLTLFDVKRRKGTGGSEYDARSIKGIRTKGKRKRKTTALGG